MYYSSTLKGVLLYWVHNKNFGSLYSLKFFLNWRNEIAYSQETKFEKKALKMIILMCVSVYLQIIRFSKNKFYFRLLQTNPMKCIFMLITAKNKRKRVIYADKT